MRQLLSICLPPSSQGKTSLRIWNFCLSELSPPILCRRGLSKQLLDGTLTLIAPAATAQTVIHVVLLACTMLLLSQTHSQLLQLQTLPFFSKTLNTQRWKGTFHTKSAFKPSLERVSQKIKEDVFPMFFFSFFSTLEFLWTLATDWSECLLQTRVGKADWPRLLWHATVKTLHHFMI